MKEQRVVVEIDREGRVTADAEGFEGEACLEDLERLLSGLASARSEVRRKPEADPWMVRRSRDATQRLGRGS